MSTDWPELEEYLQKLTQAFTDARERACEAALQSGVYGVLETWHGDGTVSFQVSASVPYGETHIHRSVG